MAAVRLVIPVISGNVLLHARRCLSLPISSLTRNGYQSFNIRKQCVLSTFLKRFHSTTSTEEGGASETEINTKSWFIRWLHGEIPEQKVVTEEEILQRRTLLEKVQEMYFSNPPKAPGLDFYVEAFDLLIKYNDRVGVENLYEVMKEEKIQADDKLINKIETFIVKAREEAWYK
ncbi:uncharacterized protein LOC124446366 [Xenia sp. Carnegie-2017]|uniref:uncharacterized protein LOC124446366 n=1 Tax=Xenia sp. Carnegie-2017 TaxID=2897299 RepID=UPI001F049411|nr:uncharacterized protein LOC124446366 [Xenia sp. Carnegie-2017]